MNFQRVRKIEIGKVMLFFVDENDRTIFIIDHQLQTPRERRLYAKHFIINILKWKAWEFRRNAYFPYYEKIK